MIPFKRLGMDNFLGFQVISTPGVIPPPPLLLDTMNSDPIIAVSTRKLRSSYSGACMRVRRGSDDTEADIGFDSNGVLDTAAIVTFADGAGGVFLHTWYGQQGGTDAGLNLVNTDTNEQPIVYKNDETLTLSGKPTVRFRGDRVEGSDTRDDRITSSNFSGTITNTHTVYLVASRTDTSSEDCFFNTGGNLPVLKTPTVDAVEYYTHGYSSGVSGNYIGSANPTSSAFILKVAVDGTNGFYTSFNNKNLTNTYTDADNFVDKTGTFIRLGYWFDTVKLDGDISEFVLVGDVAYTDRTREDSINDYYGIY